jgi:hypothetical protein
MPDARKAKAVRPPSAGRSRQGIHERAVLRDIVHTPSGNECIPRANKRNDLRNLAVAGFISDASTLTFAVLPRAYRTISV